MAGLLDFMNDPETMGLLSASAGMFNASGPSSQRRSLGQVLGAGLQGGMQGYGGAIDAQERHAMKQMELAQKKAAMDRAAQEMALMKAAMGEDGGSPGVPGQPAVPAPLAGRMPFGSGFADMAPPSAEDAQQAIQAQPQGAGNMARQMKAMQSLAMMQGKIGDAYGMMKDGITGFGRDAGKYYTLPDGTETYKADPTKGMGFDPRTNTVSAINNFSATNAAIKGDETAAVEQQKARFDPLPLGYVGQDGRPMGGSRLDYLQGGAPQAPQGQPQSGLPPFPPPLPQRGSAGSAGFPAGVRVPALAPTSGTFAQGKSDTLALLEQDLAGEANPANRAAIQREIQNERLRNGISSSAGGRPVLQSQAEKLAIEDAAKIQTEDALGKQRVTNDVDKARLLESQASTKKASQLYQQLGAALPQARELLKSATGSGGGAMVDKGLGFFGRATDGGVAADQLDTLSGWMTANVPRMEGPQSDKDVASYRQMAGMVGDRTKPTASRLAALDTLETLQNKYAVINGAASAPKSNATADKSVSLADISATAKASGRSTAEVTAALKAKGYKIGGM